MVRIHPTAVVMTGAKLAADVDLGPYAVVGEDVELASGVVVGSHVSLMGRTTVGSRTRMTEPGSANTLSPSVHKVRAAHTGTAPWRGSKSCEPTRQSGT